MTRAGEMSSERPFEPQLEALYVRHHELVRRALRKHYLDASELEDMTGELVFHLR